MEQGKDEGLVVTETVQAVLDAGMVGSLGEAQRLAALAALDEGMLQAVRFRAVTFRDGPNLNHLRFFAQDLAGFAASYAGLPFLRDHDTGRIESRDGTVRVSALQEDGGFVQEIELTTQRGIRSFLEGQIDRFSIGWHYEGVKCSVCGSDWLDAACEHLPGRKYAASEQGGKEKSGQKTQLCELYFVNPRGKEVSAVNVPAVPGTGLLAELMALKEVLMKKDVAGTTGVADVSGAMGAAEGDALRAQAGDTGPTLEEKQNVRPAQQGAGGGVDANLPACETESGATETTGTALNSDVKEVGEGWLAALLQATLDVKLMASGLSEAGKEAVRQQLRVVGDKATPTSVEKLIAVQRGVESALTQAQVVRNMRPSNVRVTENEQDRAQGVIDWALGVQNAKLPPPNLRSMRDLYLWMTEDYDFYGRWGGLNSSLAAATTGTLPALVVNALNKVLVEHYVDLSMYRWYENVAVAMPHDGSTQDVQLITMSGISNLPVVAEGAAYSEKDLSDRKVTAAFTKLGAYIGITLEMIRRNDVARMQMVPKAMMTAAIRTRSATVASIFTQASGVGPTLGYDATALFHANHGNLGTEAFDFAGWKAARIRISKQSELGSGARLGFLPRYALLPVDLYDAALNVFGYGQGSGGQPGTPNNDLNPYAEGRAGDPRPVPIVVPEFTDATDWAYMVDARLSPVIQIAYANNPPGGKHPMPEIFTVEAENQGLMFSNDTMPIKIRDWWSLGVASHVGIGKCNVAGG